MSKKMSKKRNAKKGSSAGLSKAKAVRGAMALGVGKATANKLWDDGKLTPTGKPKKGARVPATMRAALKKKTAKKSTKKKTSRKKASKRTATKRTTKKTSKRKTKKKISAKDIPKTQRTGARRRGGACYKLGGKKTPKKVSAAARRVQKGEKGRSGSVLSRRGHCQWTRNFNNLELSESQLDDY